MADDWGKLVHEANLLLKPLSSPFCRLFIYGDTYGISIDAIEPWHP